MQFLLIAILCCRQDEMKHFFHLIWDYDVNSNVKKGINYLEENDDGDGQFTIDQIIKLNQLFPNLFYPVMKLQILIQQTSLGENYWEEMKLELTHKVHEKRKMDEINKKKKKKEAETVVFDNGVTDEQLLKRMGFLKFHLMPWTRQKEKVKIAKLAAINEALEAEVENFEKPVKRNIEE